MTKQDIVIIGSGPGGYVAALYAAGQGKKVTVIEKGEIGGICLNWGCIPTKTLIRSAEIIDIAKRSKEFGIEIPSFNINYTTIKKRKDDVIATLKKGIESLFKSKKVELIKGRGRLAGKGVVDVNGTSIETENIIIATGTRPAELPAFKFDNNRILSSADMLDLEELPKSLIIIGGGVNGCEYAYTYNHFGVKVALVEMMDRLLPTSDRELGKNMEMILKKAGVKVMTRTKLDTIPDEYEKAVICVGRKYNTEDIGLEEAGLKTDKGKIVVDDKMSTNIPGIYAIGDAVGGYLLAHVASHEGIVACNNIMGQESAMDYGSVPLCIYTNPQMSMTGMTQDEAKEKGYEVKVVKFPFRGIGKSHAIGQKDGFVKIIGDEKTGTVLGVQMIGHQVTELIAEASLAVKKKMKVEDISEMIHAHPTLSEGLMEAAFSFTGKAIHSL